MNFEIEEVTVETAVRDADVRCLKELGRSIVYTVKTLSSLEIMYRGLEETRQEGGYSAPLEYMIDSHVSSLWDSVGAAMVFQAMSAGEFWKRMMS